MIHIRVIAEFGLTSSSDLWLWAIAADRLDELGGCQVMASAWREEGGGLAVAECCSPRPDVGGATVGRQIHYGDGYPAVLGRSGGAGWGYGSGSGFPDGGGDCGPADGLFQN